MNEAKIHKTTNRNNFAIQSLQDDRFKNLQECVKSTCSKIIMLEMNAKDAGEDRASIHFKSFKASGFTRMFIKRNTDNDPSIYPDDGSCSIDELQERYDGHGHMVKDGIRLKVAGKDMEWYFCFPQMGPTKKCCSIL